MRRVRLFTALAALFLLGAPFSLASGIQGGRWAATLTGICGLGLATTSVMQAREATIGSVGPWWLPVAIVVVAGSLGVVAGTAAVLGAPADAMLMAAVGVGAVCSAALACRLLHMAPLGRDDVPPATCRQP